MNDKILTPKIRFILTGFVTLTIWGHMGWDYFHGGVPTHHIQFIEHSPGISNWWGGLVLPLLSWFVLYRIQNRLHDNSESGSKDNLRYALLGFLGSFTFGILFPFFYLNEYIPSGSGIPAYVMLTLIVLSLFIPFYRAEYFLGLVLGMTYALGPILPIGAGFILTILFAITYKCIRPGIFFMKSAIKG